MVPEYFQVDAPGKVILFGEHAVVHGKTAIATSIDLRTTLTLRSLKDDAITLVIHDLQSKAQWRVDRVMQSFSSGTSLSSDDVRNKILGPLVDEGLVCDCPNASAKVACLAFLTVLFEIKLHPTAMFMELRSELPIGAGLGSSAAMSVCFASALVALKHNSVQIADLLSEINQFAFLSEQVIHGHPSGIDNTVSTFGGAIAYQRINNISTWNQIKDFPPLCFLLVNTQVPRNTKELVDRVRHRLANFPDVVEPILEAIHQIGLQVQTKGENHWKCHLPLYLSMNHDLLNALGVGHPSLDKIRKLACNHHQIGMKLTGAGGGGCALIFMENMEDSQLWNDLKSDLTSAGFSYYSTTLGVEGVKIRPL